MTEEPRDPYQDALAKPHELETLFLSGSSALPTPQGALPLTAGRHALRRGAWRQVPAWWWWAATLAALAGAFILAAGSGRGLLVPLVPTGILVVLVAAVTRLIGWVSRSRTDPGTGAVVAGIVTVMFGWLFSAWMLWTIPQALIAGETGAAAGALLGSIALPALAIGLGVSSRAAGTDARLAVRLGAVSVAAAVVGAIALTLLLAK